VWKLSSVVMTLDAQTADTRTGAGEPMSARTTLSMSTVLLIVAALIFSTGALFVRSLDHPHAWTTVFWRSLAASASLTLLLLRRERSQAWQAVKNMGRPGWIVGAAFSASSIGMVVSLSRTSVSIVLVIFALSPLAAAVLAWIILGERVQPYTWIAIAVTVGGVAFMVSDGSGSNSISGALIALVIPFSFGVGTVVIRQHPEIGMIPAMLLAAVMSLLIAAPFAHPLDVTRHDFLLLMAFGFAQLGVGLAIFGVGAAGSSPTNTALISMLEPIMGPIWVWMFLSDYPGVPALIGSGVVMLALILHTLYAASKARSSLPISLHSSG
jgi:drug/metabolite transporter (DMT)-like permease